jgi:putative FmdB family regulatory protein
MAFYKFNCVNCKEVEINVPMSIVQDIKTCPKCNSKDFSRIYSLSGISWKCSGNFGKSKNN